MTPTVEMLKVWFADTTGWDSRLRLFRHNVLVRPDGCWEWIGRRSESGHGLYDFDGNVVRVHRLMWVLAREQDLPDYFPPDQFDLKGGRSVLRHMCGEGEHPWCIRPSHLIGGTWSENNIDRWALHGEPRAYGPAFA